MTTPSTIKLLHIININHTASMSRVAILSIAVGLSLFSLHAQAQITPQQIAKLLASDGAAGDNFGEAIAISGATAVVGTRLNFNTSPGAAYVFVRDAAGVWTQQAKLLASDGAVGDQFGLSVAISGETIVIGADSDDGVAVNSGSAYVFVRDAAGVWAQQAKLLPSDGAATDIFGNSVAIDGDTAIIGARLDDDNGADSGSAYVFARIAPGVWVQQSKLLPVDGAANNNFGVSVAISADTAIVGARFGDGIVTDSGSAYVFNRGVAGAWTPEAKLLASDGGANNFFGLSVDVSGNFAIVGAPFDDDNGQDSGSAYVFERDAAGLWTQQANLLPSDGTEFDNSGISVSISGDTAVIGASGDADNGFGSGSAYVYIRNAVGLWTLKDKLTASDGAPGDRFGNSVAISVDTAVIGAFGDDDNGNASGSAYIFDLAPPPGPSADLNGDGLVNATDLALLLANWAP